MVGGRGVGWRWQGGGGESKGGVGAWGSRGWVGVSEEGV